MTSTLLYVLAILYAVQQAVALPTSQQQIHPYVVVYLSLGNAGVICALLVYIARGLLKGRRIGAGMALVTYLLFQSFIIVAASLTAGSTSVPLLKVVHLVYFTSCATTFVFMLKVWVHATS